MDEQKIKTATATDILKAIKTGSIPYAPAWWSKHGEEIRRIGRWRIFYIQTFEIGDQLVHEGIYYLDDVILKVEEELNKKATNEGGH